MARPIARRLAASALLVLAASCSASKAGVKNPERQSDAEYDLAIDSMRRQEPRTALDHATKAVEFNPENSRAHYLTSTIFGYFCSGPRGLESPDCQIDNAEKHARLAMKTDPEFRDARNLLGQVLILRARYREAIDTLTPLVNDPAYSASFLAWGNLGWAQVLNGSIQEGIRSLENAVTQPRFCVGNYRLGVAYGKNNELERAEVNLTRAVQSEEAECAFMQEAWKERGVVRERRGNLSGAREDFAKCKELSPESNVGRACSDKLAVLTRGGTP